MCVCLPLHGNCSLISVEWSAYRFVVESSSRFWPIGWTRRRGNLVLTGPLVKFHVLMVTFGPARPRAAAAATTSSWTVTWRLLPQFYLFRASFSWRPPGGFRIPPPWIRNRNCRCARGREELKFNRHWSGVWIQEIEFDGKGELKVKGLVTCADPDVVNWINNGRMMTIIVNDGASWTDVSNIPKWWKCSN